MKITRGSGFLALALSSVLMLSGCAVDASDDSLATNAASSETAAPASSASASPETVKFSVSCSNPVDSVSTAYATYKEAWEWQDKNGVRYSSCEGVPTEGSLYEATDAGVARAAGYTSVSSVKSIYGMCAETDTYYANPSGGALSDGQVLEAKAMLMLCPDHPQASQIQAALDSTVKVDQEIAEGKRFYDGTYVVGTDIQPGTYVISAKVTNCYWERQDANGEIIDNNFITAANRVQVTIAKSDYGFHAEGCGEWVKQ